MQLPQLARYFDDDLGLASDLSALVRAVAAVRDADAGFMPAGVVAV
jgi:hypothetical protein